MFPSHTASRSTVSNRISLASGSPAAYACPSTSLLTRSRSPPAKSSIADLRPNPPASLARAFLPIAVPDASTSIQPFLPQLQRGPL